MYLEVFNFVHTVVKYADDLIEEVVKVEAFVVTERQKHGVSAEKFKVNVEVQFIVIWH